MSKKFLFTNCKPSKTHMSTSLKISADSDGIDVNPTLYRGMIGLLHYLTASRLYIMFATNIYTRFQENP